MYIFYFLLVLITWKHLNQYEVLMNLQVWLLTFPLIKPYLYITCVIERISNGEANKVIKTIPYQSSDKNDCGNMEPKDTKKLLGAIKIDLRFVPNFTEFSKFSKSWQNP